jgi:membrane protein YdbS with pleckstrin-like domain
MTAQFQNSLVDIDALPQIENLEFIPIDRNYLKVSLISRILIITIGAIAPVLFIHFNEEISYDALPIIGGAYVVLMTTSITLLRMGFKKKKYALREKDIIYTKGLIWSVRTAIPFNRIQHAEIKQGPLERKFNLSSLKVFTAGGQSSDLMIPGLPSEKAQQLKDFVLGKTAEDGE